MTRPTNSNGDAAITAATMRCTVSPEIGTPVTGGGSTIAEMSRRASLSRSLQLTTSLRAADHVEQSLAARCHQPRPQLAQEIGMVRGIVEELRDHGRRTHVREHLRRIARHEYGVEFSLDYALKDVRLAVDRDKLPVVAALASSWQRAVDRGFGHDGVTVLMRALDESPS
jgi:hypothetical protein